MPATALCQLRVDRTGSRPRRPRCSRRAASAPASTQHVRQHRRASARRSRARKRAEQRRIDDPPEAVAARDRDRRRPESPDSPAAARRTRRASRDELTTISVSGRAAASSRPSSRLASKQRIASARSMSQRTRIGRSSTRMNDAHRRAAPRAAVAGERLHLAPLGEERHRQQVAGRLRALSAAALDDDLQHESRLLRHPAQGWSIAHGGRKSHHCRGRAPCRSLEQIKKIAIPQCSMSRRIPRPGRHRTRRATAPTRSTPSTACTRPARRAAARTRA